MYQYGTSTSTAIDRAMLLPVATEVVNIYKGIEPFTLASRSPIKSNLRIELLTCTVLTILTCVPYDQSCEIYANNNTIDCIVPNRYSLVVWIGRPNSSNSIAFQSLLQILRNLSILPIPRILSQFLKFCCPIGAKSTLTRFAPLRALTPFEVYIWPYLVGLNVRGSGCGHIICISSRSY